MDFVGRRISEEWDRDVAEAEGEYHEFPYAGEEEGAEAISGIGELFPRVYQRLRPIVEVVTRSCCLGTLRRTVTKTIRWTEKAEGDFKEIQKRLEDSQMLYFLNDTDPVVLQTDASDYGIGAYLFQLVDGKERPIVFLSKSLGRRAAAVVNDREGVLCFILGHREERVSPQRKAIPAAD